MEARRYARNPAASDAGRKRAGLDATRATSTFPRDDCGKRRAGD
jgi:hypothetical protein